MSQNLNIAQIGHPVLRKKTKTVPINYIKKNKFQSLIDNLISTMKIANGAGLAANQIYAPYRICCLEVMNNSRYKHLEDIPLKVLINPIIKVIDESDTFDSYEGCLSVPNLRGKVKRFKKINIRYYDREANYIEENIIGLPSIVYQHEIDHLDGILFTDKVYDNSTLVTYSNYLEYHQKKYEKELTKFIESCK